MYCSLEGNANVNGKWKNGATPLFEAAQQGHAEACTLLGKGNGNENEKTENGATS